MRNMRTVTMLILAMIVMMGICGCAGDHNSNRKETDQEYALLMQDYIEEKYAITVDIVEQIVPQEGFNTGLEEHILVVRDENGVIANIKARLSTPYDYYDDYIESCTAASIQKELGINVSSDNAKIYVALNAKEVDTSAANIASLIFVSMVDGSPDDSTLNRLYEIYHSIQQKRYDNVSFLVGFTDGSAEFDKAVENYMVHGQSEWKDYSGEVFAELYVTDMNLSFDEFKESANYDVMQP